MAALFRKARLFPTCAQNDEGPLLAGLRRVFNKDLLLRAGPPTVGVIVRAIIVVAGQHKAPRGKRGERVVSLIAHADASSPPALPSCSGLEEREFPTDLFRLFRWYLTVQGQQKKFSKRCCQRKERGFPSSSPS